MEVSAAENGAAEDPTSAAAAQEASTLRHTSSEQGSGNAANALETFLDSAAQPTSRHSHSFSRYCSSSTAKGNAWGEGLMLRGGGGQGEGHKKGECVCVCMYVLWGGGGQGERKEGAEGVCSRPGGGR